MTIREHFFAWKPMVDRNFHKLENGLSRQGGLYKHVSQYLHVSLFGYVIYSSAEAHC